MGHLITLLSSKVLPLVADSFNRPNNATSVGTTEVGGLTWTTFTGSVFGIQNGQVYLVTAGSAVDRLIVTPASLPANYAVQGAFPVATTINQRVVFRFQDASNECFVGASTTNYELFQRVGNTVTSLATTTRAPASGDVIRIEVRGNSVSVAINGVYYITNFNLTALASALGCGFCTAGGLGARFDDFRVEPLA